MNESFESQGLAGSFVDGVEVGLAYVVGNYAGQRAFTYVRSHSVAHHAATVLKLATLLVVIYGVLVLAQLLLFGHLG